MKLKAVLYFVQRHTLGRRWQFELTLCSKCITESAQTDSSSPLDLYKGDIHTDAKNTLNVKSEIL